MFWQAEELEFDYLNDMYNPHSDRLYGADLLVTERLLHELINYEIGQSGLNLSHSQV
jgi:cadherin EGF LAG seven-pass G-type receptor 1